MPQLNFSQAMTANQLGFNPLSGWQFEFNPYPRAVVQLYLRATTTGVRAAVSSGSTTILERSQVQGGGTAGVTPNQFTTSPIQWISSGGDRLKLAIDEVAGGTPTVDGLIVIEPL